MKNGDRGPGTGDREGPSATVVALSRALELVNGAARALYARGILPARHAAVPVISVGNIAMGGTGKTPLVAALATALRRHGARPAILTRGYRRRDSTPRLVVHNPGAGWEEIGDEPAVLARALPEVPIVVDADRVRGAAVAVAQGGATHIILDDGFQHWRLVRDLDIVTVDPRDPLCERRLRREHPRALAGADAAVVIDAAPGALDAVRALVATVAPSLRLFPCRLQPSAAVVGADRHDAPWLRGRRALAFAGIANPRRFAATLAGLGAEVVETRSFPDHHVYAEAEIAEILDRARALAAVAVTTEKDAVKIAAPALARIAVLAVELVPEGGDLLDLLAPLLAGAPRAEDRLESRP
jgi:tetraacyldisaccharide 4'-kinase